MEGLLLWPDSPEGAFRALLLQKLGPQAPQGQGWSPNRSRSTRCQPSQLWKVGPVITTPLHGPGH